MADNNKKKYIKYEDTTYFLEDSRIPDPSSDDNGKVLGVVNGAYALKQEQGGGGGGAVASVNGKSGAVVLDASDVGALPDDTVIPPAVTEQTVSGWGFTKNTGTYSLPSGGIPDSDIASAATWNAKGTYSKPSGGIPKSDLASDVQTSLGKADTALQSHQSLSGYATEQWVEGKGYQTAQQVQTAIASAAELPSGGSVGDFLRKTASGVAWQTVPSAESNSFGGGTT